jgi:hypothetical protein
MVAIMIKYCNVAMRKGDTFHCNTAMKILSTCMVYLSPSLHNAVYQTKDYSYVEREHAKFCRKTLGTTVP